MQSGQHASSCLSSTSHIPDSKRVHPVDVLLFLSNSSYLDEFSSPKITKLINAVMKFQKKLCGAKSEEAEEFWNCEFYDFLKGALGESAFQSVIAYCFSPDHAIDVLIRWSNDFRWTKRRRRAVSFLTELRDADFPFTQVELLYNTASPSDRLVPSVIFFKRNQLSCLNVKVLILDYIKLSNDCKNEIGSEIKRILECVCIKSIMPYLATIKQKDIEFLLYRIRSFKRKVVAYCLSLSCMKIDNDLLEEIRDCLLTQPVR